MRSAYCMHSGKSVSEELPEHPPGWVTLPGRPHVHVQWRNFHTSIFLQMWSGVKSNASQGWKHMWDVYILNHLVSLYVCVLEAGAVLTIKPKAKYSTSELSTSTYDLTTQPKLAFNSRASCLRTLNAKVVVRRHRVQFRNLFKCFGEVLFCFVVSGMVAVWRFWQDGGYIRLLGSISPDFCLFFTYGFVWGVLFQVWFFVVDVVGFAYSFCLFFQQV